MKNKTDFRIGIGTSSILLMLVVLALTALSLLAYSSARNNATLANRDLHMTLAYYEAAAKAQRDLCTMDALLADSNARTTMAIDTPIVTAAATTASAGDTQTAEPMQSNDAAAWQAQFVAHDLGNIIVHIDLSYTLTIDAGESRVLVVEGQLSPGAATRYTITRHELVNTASYPEPTLQLMMP